MRSTQRKSSSRNAKRGITLILVAGVLAVLAAMATGFYSITLSQTKSATRYADTVRAELMARAGIEHALAQLREQVFRRTENVSDPWYTVDYLRGARKRVSFAAELATNQRDDDGDGRVDNEEEKHLSFSMALGSTVGPVSDRFTVNVSDAASKINVNAGDNLAVMLDNLCRAIGPPLVAAEPDALQPRRWSQEGATTGDYDNGLNADDKPENYGIYYWLYDYSGKVVWDGQKRLSPGTPKTKPDGTALYGDGYAIAGYRARQGRFKNLEDVKSALTYVERNNNNLPDDPLEQLEIDVKFAALRDYITIDSFVDTTTVCVGKFEWLQGQSSGSYTIAIDRDKSWVADDIYNDPDNTRGSLRGCYVSIVNGHGAGQFRKIKTNGVDWIELDKGFVVPPGPISSYMIIAKPDAKPDPYDPESTIAPDRLDYQPDGDLVDDPLIDYAVRPLCIHRAPVNINTASDKVLVALFMGLNIQHGHPMSIATDVDRQKLVPLVLKSPPAADGDTDWKVQEYRDRGMEPYLLTLRGLKRVPADSGKLTFDCTLDPLKILLKSTDPDSDVDYIGNYGRVDPKGSSQISEAHELALRVISARQRKIDAQTRDFVASDPDPLSADPRTGAKGIERGPFRSWDDFYFRVVRPWDDAEARYNDPRKISVARMLMAHFNSNTDILKFNPNIEWIDRWGRNFTEMEPVMIFDDGANEPKWVDYAWPASAASDGMWNSPLVAAGKRRGAYYTRSMRYKSEELLDKTDMNRSTTEFCFDSSGVFEIQSVGQVMARRDLQAERKLVALVKLYDVWRESTQAQFVRGVFSEAENGDTTRKGWEVKGAHHEGDYSGRVTRDARNGLSGPPKRLSIDTLPEPLTPLRARINAPGGLADVVDTRAPDGRDAWGNPREKGQPDVVANRVIPAYYDGQIVIATNTSAYNPSGNDDDTFLASFDGDLDTATAVGNGREQAKTPTRKEVRVIDTFGLLGVLNDTEVDFDPKEPLPGKLEGGQLPYDFFAVKSINEVMRALNPQNYWENVTCRMGDLRPDGVFLGNVGISGKDATLKYLVDKNWPLKDAKEGTVMCWFKPTWHSTDGQEHEFFSAVGIGDGYSARGNHLRKSGRFTGIIRYGVNGSSNGGGGGANNDLGCHTEDDVDIDMIADIHGGTRGVPAQQRVSPAFRTQPFRWSFTGMTMKYKVKLATWPYPSATHDTSVDEVGFYATGGAKDLRNKDNAENVLRPFICSDRTPEGKDWTAQSMHTKVTGSPTRDPDIGKNMNIAQEAAWPWADGATKGHWIFGANNLNSNINKWLYRSSPIDGTQAVVDEYKLTKKHWETQRIADEMTTSRYYLPRDPRDPSQCPLFTSQSLLQSLKGAAQTGSDEEVTVARVSWNCFTPRFLYENRELQDFRKRSENYGDKGAAASIQKIKYRGPFDYIQYNLDILPRATAADPRPGEAQLAGNEPVVVNVNGKNVQVLSVDRPAPDAYFPERQSYATKGVEVELVKDVDGRAASGDEIVLGRTFLNPDENNNVSNVKDPIRVKTSQLRYRVRFRYPVDPLVASVYGETNNTVDPSRHYMLDTPVFDDVSVTYFTRPRILTYREVNE